MVVVMSASQRRRQGGLHSTARNVRRARVPVRNFLGAKKECRIPGTGLCGTLRGTEEAASVAVFRTRELVQKLAREMWRAGDGLTIDVD